MEHWYCDHWGHFYWSQNCDEMTVSSYCEPANTLSTQMVPMLHYEQLLRAPASCHSLQEAYYFQTNL
jgi:hypothetical protein